MSVLSPDLTAVARRCAKCRSRKAVLRHHKGCDKYLGRFNPWIRKNYWKFIECVRLCNECHEEIHRLYLPLFRFPHRTPRDAAVMRKRLIKLCDLWLATRYHVRSPLPGPHRTRLFSARRSSPRRVARR